MLELDHVAVSGETLDEARAFVEEALGVPLQPGGRHDVFHTHNALLGLEDGLYLEAIAADPDARKPDRARWFDLDRFEGRPRLTNWICRTTELSDMVRKFRFDLGAPVELQRGDLKWAMAVPDDGILPFDNCAPAVIQWKTEKHPAATLDDRGVRLRHLAICHPQSGLLAEAIQPFLSDIRIIFETGSPGFHAEFDTPHGKREITR